MRTQYFLRTLALLLAIGAASGDASPQETQLTRTGARKTLVVAAIERCKGAVVNLHSERAGSQGRPISGMGTGIVIDPRGWIVTNDHVVDDVTQLRCTLEGGESHPAEIVARNKELDLAIIKIPVKKPLPTMPLGTASDLMLGETVIAIGNAFGYEHSVSHGIVSALKRDVSLNAEMKYKGLIQTDAPINPGNSGGPLINVHGEMIGVNVAIRDKAQNIGFAIPVDQMILSVHEMLRSRRPTHDGITVRDRLRDSGDGLVRSVEVENVDSRSPGHKAGLEMGDVILKVGDVAAVCSFDVERALMEHKAGDKVVFVVRRQGSDQSREVFLSSKELLAQLAKGGSESKSSPLPAATADAIWTKLGLRLTPVAATKVMQEKGLDGGLEVTEVNKEGSAGKAGIAKGDILVGLHHWQTASLENVAYVLNHEQRAEFSPLMFYIIRAGKIRKGHLP